LRYEAERILIRCPNWVGDVVMATPALRCIRRNYPRARITLLLRPYVREVLEGAPWFDEILEVGPPGAKSEHEPRARRKPYFSLVRQLRARRFDLALLLTHSFRTALTAWLVRAKHSVGYTRWDQWCLLTDRIPWPRERGAWAAVPKVETYMRLCERLGCEGTDDRRQELFFTRQEKQAASALLHRHGRDAGRGLAALVPGAAYGASKLWSTDKFARVGDALAERHGFQVIILASPAEEALARDIARRMKHRAIRSRPGEMSLGLLKPVIAGCSLVVCTDTGPRHFGVAFDVPTVVIMGPTDPRRTDSDYARTIIVRKDVPCGPCQLRKCPLDHACMKLITPAMVLDAADRLLGGADQSGAATAARPR